MIYDNCYLNQLYNDLLSNSPQTIALDIPNELGSGRITQTKIKHGVVLSDWELNYRSDMNVQGCVSKEYMQIIFCLNDGISWGTMDERRSVSILIFPITNTLLSQIHGKNQGVCFVGGR